MPNYILIKNNTVANVAVFDSPPALPAYDAVIDAASIDVKPGPGWTYHWETGTFTPPADAKKPDAKTEKIAAAAAQLKDVDLAAAKQGSDTNTLLITLLCAVLDVDEADLTAKISASAKG